MNFDAEIDSYVSLDFNTPDKNKNYSNLNTNPSVTNLVSNNISNYNDKYSISVYDEQ
jgi:hypothetical protein